VLLLFLADNPAPYYELFLLDNVSSGAAKLNSIGSRLFAVDIITFT